MDERQIRRWLPLIGTRAADSNQSWVQAPCPFARWSHASGTDDHPSFGVRVEPGESLCNCFSCEEGCGPQVEVLIRLRGVAKGCGLDFATAMRAVVDAEEGVVDGLELEWGRRGATVPDVVFPESWLKRFPRAYSGSDVHWYLEERGMPRRVAEAMDVRYALDEDRVCFPIRNRVGALVGLHGRTVLPDVEPRYKIVKWNGNKNSLAWYGEHAVDVERPVVIVESVFDAARVLEVYDNVISPLSASLSVEKINRVRYLNHVVVMMDPDKAGRAATKKLRRVLDSMVVLDVVELGDKDPGDMVVPEVVDALSAHVDLDPSMI